jgi:hypothetical protein
MNHNRIHKNCLVTTKSGIVIGCAAPAKMPKITRHGVMLQRALLDKRTAQEQSIVQRVAGAVWGRL